MKKIVFLLMWSCCFLLLAGSEKTNLLTNGDLKKVLPLKEYKAKYPLLRMDPGLETNVPEGWGMFRSGRKDIRWGISEKVRYNGQRSFYMKGAKGLRLKKGKINFRYLLLGNCDGYEYRYLPELKPSTEYYFSVRVKGNAGLVRAMVISKSVGFDTPSHRALIRNSTHLHLREDQWTLLSGKFRTPEKVSRVVLALLTPGIEEGKVLYAAAPILREVEPILPRKKSSVLRAGIYSPEKEIPLFREKICQYLKEASFQAKIITDLRKETLSELDLLVLTTFRERSEKDKRNDNIDLEETDIPFNMLHFLNRGGGLILGHDCVGFRGSLWKTPLFPEICSGKEIVFDKNVGFAKGAFLGSKPFLHSYYDHVALRVGKRGRVQALDSKKNPVIVSGAGERGRIVAFGFPVGIDHKDRSLKEFIPEEKALLVSAAKWASSAPKFHVDPMHTLSGAYMNYVQKLALASSGELKRQQEEEKRFSTLALPRLEEISMVMANKVNDTEEALRQRIRNCRKVGFNTIKMHVNNGHSLYYDSKHFPRCKAPHCKFDTLRVAKDECKKQGMKFSVFIHSFASLRNYKRPCGCDLARTVLKNEYEKIQSGEMKNSAFHKELVTLPNGKRSIRWECLSDEKNVERYRTMVREVVQKYKPFEINFDFVRYQLGYESPCYCQNCLKRKESFARKNPALSGEKLDQAYAQYELKRVFNLLFAEAKKADPEVLVSCYTYAENCDWVFSYEVDRHLRYVSGRIGPGTPLAGIPSLMKKYTGLLRKYNPKAELLPLLVNYDSKNGVRMKAEFSLVSQGWDQIRPKVRTVEFAGYGYLFEPVAWLKRDKPEYDAINGISRALKGSWHENEGKILK